MVLTLQPVRDMDGCGATAALRPRERRRLSNLPNGADEVPWNVSCDLEPGHDGPHYAGTQADMASGGEYWVCFGETFRSGGEVSIQMLSPCPVYGSSETKEDPCLLFDGHPGRHQVDAAQPWNSTVQDVPEPAPGARHADYLEHYRQALASLEATDDPAAVHAQLATASALARLADLLSQQRM